MDRSLCAFILYLYRVVAPSGSLETFGLILKVVLWLWVVAAVFIVREIYGFCRRPTPSAEDLISSCAWIMFAIIFIGSSQFYSWYIGMLFPVALLLNSQEWLRRFVIVLSGTHVLSLTSLSRKGIGYFIMTTGLGSGRQANAAEPSRSATGQS